MLLKNENASIRLDFVSYEFPETEYGMDEYDKNWLQLRCTWVDEDGYTHKDSNACLLARALEREEDESPVFSDGRAVLAGLTVEEIGSLAARWSVLRRESDPGLNVTEEELENVKKNSAVTRENGCGGGC